MANEQGTHEPLQSLIYDVGGARFIAEPKFLHKPSGQERGNKGTIIHRKLKVSRSGVRFNRHSGLPRRRFPAIADEAARWDSDFCPVGLADSTAGPPRRSNTHSTACSRKQTLVIKCGVNSESLLYKDLQITNVIMVAPNR